MVPKFSRRGRGIKGVALYVLHDKGKADTAKRVGFTATRNLSTDDPNMAWRLMCITAQQRNELKAAAGIRRGGREATNFCAHISLSWHPDEKPTDAEMERAADSLLKAYGYDKLQALLVRHNDQDHEHLHVVVCLINPENGCAAPNVKDDFKKILQPWAYEYEKENGNIVCQNRARDMEVRQRSRDPANSNDPPTTDKPARVWLSRAEWEAQRAAEQDAKRQLSAELSAQHKAERQQMIEATRAEIRASAATTRAAFREEWATLYKEQRQERRQLDVFETRAQTELELVLKSAHGRLEYVHRYRELLEEVGGVGAWQAIFSPDELQDAVSEALAARREMVETAHAEAVAAVSERADAARHTAQREIWQHHNERMEELRSRQGTERRAVWRSPVPDRSPVEHQPPADMSQEQHERPPPQALPDPRDTQSDAEAARKARAAELERLLEEAEKRRQDRNRDRDLER